MTKAKARAKASGAKRGAKQGKWVVVETNKFTVDFITKWNALPPLVRASIASGLMFHCSAHAGDATKEEEIHRGVGLDRRAEVASHFADGFKLVAEYFAELTRASDEEYVARTTMGEPGSRWVPMPRAEELLKPAKGAPEAP